MSGRTWLAVSIILLVTISRATIINVPSDQSTIQAGIDATSNGDTVLVQPGTYVENINYNGKNIVVGSLFLITGDTSYISQTVIDGNRDTSVVMFLNGEDSTAVLTGFMITNGSSSYGGGLFSDSTSSPSLINITVSGNMATYDGGGIYCRYSNLSLENITVYGNTAISRGGGTFIGNGSNPSLKNVTISGNTAGSYGGGIVIRSGSNPILENVTICGNTADSYGGGIVIRTDANPILKNVTISGNTTDSYGGGIVIRSGSSPILENVTISSNKATTGGGVRVRSYSNPTFKNVLITGNTATLDTVWYYGGEGGGIYVDGDSSPIFINSTICGNSADSSGGGIFIRNNSHPILVNTILWDDLPQEIYIPQEDVYPDTITITYSNVQGGEAGIVAAGDSDLVAWLEGNINSDPLFADTAKGDYHLSKNSPCIGTGVELIQIDGSWYYSPDTDIDGNARSMPVGTKPDMGAYENQTITPIAGLVAYYPFNGNANDESGKGNDGTVNGAILTADRFGKANSAYSFDGVDDYIETSEFQMTTNSFSVSYWVYDDEYDAGFHGGHLYCYVTSSSYDRFWFIDYSDGSGIGYKVGDSDADEIVLYQPTVPSPGWHHVLGTFDNDQHESRLFIDGELSISGINASLVITSMTRKLVVGTADTGYGYWFRGKIDDIRIFNLALSEAEIQALYHEGSGDAGNTISHWTFDEMAGDTLYDVSSNGHHGVITKASWAEGYSGGALQFGDSAYVTVPYAVDTRPVEAITLEAIVLFETFDPMQAIVSTSEYGGYGLWIYNSIPDIYIQIDSVYYSAAYSGGLVTDRWYHIAGVFDGSAVKYYINRALKDSVPASGNITYQYENALQIGAEAGKEDLPELRTSFHGRIDAIRISGRALSPGEFLAFDAISVAVSPVQSDVPEGFSLHPAYPNPFNPVSTIRYDLPQKSEVALTVYDILGREVVRLVEGYIEPGYHQVKWDGRDKGGREVPSGIYIARLAAQEYSTSIKMLLMR